MVDGQCLLKTNHPDTPDLTPEPVDTLFLGDAAAEFGAPFITVDLAQRSDGEWRVIEVGVGQVSDWPESRHASDLVIALIRSPLL